MSKIHVQRLVTVTLELTEIEATNLATVLSLGINEKTLNSLKLKDILDQLISAQILPMKSSNFTSVAMLSTEKV